MKTPLYTLEARVNGRWKLLAWVPEYPQMPVWDNLVALWQDLMYNSRLTWSINEEGGCLMADAWTTHTWEWLWDPFDWRVRRDGVDLPKSELYDAHHWLTVDSRFSPTGIDMEYVYE